MKSTGNCKNFYLIDVMNWRRQGDVSFSNVTFPCNLFVPKFTHTHTHKSFNGLCHDFSQYDAFKNKLWFYLGKYVLCMYALHAYAIFSIKNVRKIFISLPQWFRKIHTYLYSQYQTYTVHLLTPVDVPEFTHTSFDSANRVKADSFMNITKQKIVDIKWPIIVTYNYCINHIFNIKC